MPGKKSIPIVTARLPVDKVIGLSLYNIEKPFYTRCEITAHFGGSVAKLRQNYFWNGANQPRLIWTFLGLTPTDPRTALASGFHDDGCESDDVPQVMADALFVSLLGPVDFNGERLPGISKFEQVCCYIGVRFYSLFVRPTTRLFWQKDN